MSFNISASFNCMCFTDSSRLGMGSSIKDVRKDTCFPTSSPHVLFCPHVAYPPLLAWTPTSRGSVVSELRVLQAMVHLTNLHTRSGGLKCGSCKQPPLGAKTM